MSNESTINKLVEMRMTPMADAFRAQLRDPSVCCKLIILGRGCGQNPGPQ